MSKEMNKFIIAVLKYELVGTIIFSLILSILVDINFSLIIVYGLAISFLNFVSNSLITEYVLKKKKKGIFYPMTYFIRILITVVLAIPIIFSLKTVIAFILGYVSHFVFLTLYWIKSQKGSG